MDCARRLRRGVRPSAPPLTGSGGASVAAAFALAGLASCAGNTVEIPSKSTEFSGPARHPLRVAILPLTDARTVDEAPDADGEYVYRGLVFEGTNLDWLRPRPMDRVTRRFAEALLRTGVFAELVLVPSADRARDADLVLRGTVRRARGYVQRDPPEGEDPWVLSEVVFDELEIIDTDTEEVRFAGATGWSIWEQRPPPVDPWAVLGETLDEAAARLSAVLISADFASFVVEPRVALPSAVAEAPRASAELAPDGWVHARTSTTTTPRGWDGDAACRSERFTQRQALHFHRRLGPYVPHVFLWRCPSDVRLRRSSRVELPAVLLGTDAEERWVFGLALGQSNWPHALEQLGNALNLAAPESPYVVEVAGGDVRTLRGRTDRPGPRAVPPGRTVGCGPEDADAAARSPVRAP